jgi:hypothetical protein
MGLYRLEQLVAEFAERSLWLALVAATRPRLVAYPIAALGAWIGLTLVIRAYKLHVAARAASSQERP